MVALPTTPNEDRPEIVPPVIAAAPADCVASDPNPRLVRATDCVPRAAISLRLFCISKGPPDGACAEAIADHNSATVRRKARIIRPTIGLSLIAL